MCCDCHCRNICEFFCLLCSSFNFLLGLHYIMIIFISLMIGVHTKNLVAILHLLVALARHFRAPIRFPENVCVTLLVVQVSINLYLWILYVVGRERMNVGMGVCVCVCITASICVCAYICAHTHPTTKCTCVQTINFVFQTLRILKKVIFAYFVQKVEGALQTRRITEEITSTNE